MFYPWKDKPQFEVDKVHRVAYLDSEVDLVCSADCYETCKYQWEKDGKKIERNVKTINNASKLTVLMNNDTTNYATYQCKATNDVGSSLKLFHVEK